jgi:hypothetical protein
MHLCTCVSEDGRCREEGIKKKRVCESSTTDCVLCLVKKEKRKNIFSNQFKRARKRWKRERQNSKNGIFQSSPPMSSTLRGRRYLSFPRHQGRRCWILTVHQDRRCLSLDHHQGRRCVCFIVTRKILGFYISVVNSSRRNVL